MKLEKALDKCAELYREMLGRHQGKIEGAYQRSGDEGITINMAVKIKPTGPSTNNVIARISLMGSLLRISERKVGAKPRKRSAWHKRIWRWVFPRKGAGQNPKGRTHARGGQHEA